MRIVCGGKWTSDGRWVVVGGRSEQEERIIFDPGNGMNGADDFTMALVDLRDCQIFVAEQSAA